jgi:hypothetical protein
VADDDHFDIELRSPATVAERCVIISTLVRRLWIESSFASGNAEDWTTEAFDLREWLRSENIWTGLTTFEADFLQRPVGSVTEDDLMSTTWQAEALATLGWAMGLTDHLPPGDLGDITAVIQAVPAPWDSVSAWVLGAWLRSEAEIAVQRDRAEIFEWRIGIERPFRLATGQERSDYIEAIENVVREAGGSGLLEREPGSEFSIRDSPLASFDDLSLERMAALAEERLRALNWLCGFGSSWDDVPLDV